MQRIMILGGPGSGKSTLARWWETAQACQCTTWITSTGRRAGWSARPQKSYPWCAAVEAHERWVFEGGMSSTYASRAARANVIIWLDLPVGLRLCRVARRSWRYRGQVRPDLAAGCPEQLNGQTLAFLRWIWAFRHISRQKVVDLIDAQPSGKVIHHLQSPAEVTKFQSTLNM